MLEILAEILVSIFAPIIIGILELSFNIGWVVYELHSFNKKSTDKSQLSNSRN